MSSLISNKLVLLQMMITEYNTGINSTMLPSKMFNISLKMYLWQSVDLVDFHGKIQNASFSDYIIPIC